MPTIPRIQEQTVQSELLPLVQMDVNAGASRGGGGGGGSGLHGNVRGAADRLAAQHNDERERAELDAAQLAVLEASEFSDHLMNGDEIDLPGHEGPGLAHRMGPALFGAVDAAETFFEERMAQIYEGLSPGVQKKARLPLRKLTSSHKTQVDTHEAKQRTVHYRKTYEDGMAGAIRDGLNAGRQGVALQAGVLRVETVDEALTDIDHRIRVYATTHPGQLGGLSEDRWIDTEKLARGSEFHELMLGDLTSRGMVEEAVDYFERYEGQLLDPARIRWRKGVQDGAERGEVSLLASQLRDAMPIDVTALAELGPAKVISTRVAAVREAGKTRGWTAARTADAEQEISAAARREQAAAQAVHDENFQEVDRAIRTAGGDLAAVHMKYGRVWQEAHPEELAAWSKRADAVMGNAVGLVEQNARLHELYEEMLQDPESFKGRNLKLDEVVLGRDWYEQMTRTQAGLRQGDAALYKTHLSVSGIVNQYLKDVYPTADKEGNEAERAERDAESRSISERLIEIQRSPGVQRPLDAAEVHTQIREDLDRRRAERVIGTSSFFGIEFTDTESRFEIPASRVPPHEVLRIEQRMIENSIPVTNAGILAVWDREQLEQGGS
ncbi:hypothetical protein DRQ32_07450 [bacterium]|nr:MAG: hypothetical protein DRQ32_07450 [bacterium]